jgi:hypothetical protein
MLCLTTSKDFREVGIILSNVGQKENLEKSDRR